MITISPALTMALGTWWVLNKCLLERWMEEMEKSLDLKSGNLRFPPGAVSNSVCL